MTSNYSAPRSVSGAKRAVATAAHALAFPARLERSGRYSVAQGLCDVLVGCMAAMVGDAFWLGRAWDMETSALIGVAMSGLLAISLAQSPTWSRRNAVWQAATLLAGSVLIFTLLPWVAGMGAISINRTESWRLLGLALPGFILTRLVANRQGADTPLESFRWALAAAAGLAFAGPLLSTRSVGTGDAYWYAGMVGDFTTQLRAGIFPVLGGQSEFAFNGAVSPLRFAPLLQHTAGLIDLVTGRSLNFFGLLNLTLVASMVAGAVSTYACLVRTNAAARWIALGLAVLVASSPAVLSLAYTGDLFMSVCTLPYVPLTLCFLHESLVRRTTRATCLLALALAAIWLAHAPIAFWMTAVAATGQLVRLVKEGRSATLWRSWAAAAVVFITLAGFVFVSVVTLGLPAVVADREMVLANLRSAFPGALLPISDNAAALTDYQLGWSLWWVLLAALIGALTRRGRFEVTLAACIVLFLALLLPIPSVLSTLWGHMPQAVINVTFYWPMQRLYLPLAAMSVFGAYATCAGLIGRKRWLTATTLVGIGFALDWSGAEASRFLERGRRNTAVADTARISHLPQNRVLTRYAYSPFAQVPSYYSHGYVDPLWENRLLAQETLIPFDSNYGAIIGRAGKVVAEGNVALRRDAPQNYVLLISPVANSGRRYALDFDFAQPETRGTLVVSSPSISRVYDLPDSGFGMPLAGSPMGFGSTATSHHAISLSGVPGAAETLSVQLYTESVIEPAPASLGSYRWLDYDPSLLPVAVDSWIPYRARVTSDRAAWLETPRMYIEGYVATVDGAQVNVARSPDGLVMIPVPAAASNVTLAYRGPWALQAAYWASLAGWAGALVLLIRGALVTRPRPDGVSW